MKNLSYKNEDIETKSKNTWHDWLIKYIPEPIRKIVGGFKDKVVSLFETDTSKDCGKQFVYGIGKKLNKPKTQKHPEGIIIINVSKKMK